jgi:hypothetical protein
MLGFHHRGDPRRASEQHHAPLANAYPALVLNCTLKRSPQESNTEALARVREH